MTDIDQDLLRWLGQRGSASALRAEVEAAFGGRVDDLDGWLRQLELADLLQLLDPAGLDQRVVLTESAIARLPELTGRSS